MRIRASREAKLFTDANARRAGTTLQMGATEYLLHLVSPNENAVVLEITAGELRRHGRILASRALPNSYVLQYQGCLVAEKLDRPH